MNKPIIYCDLDGVLADFNQHYKNLFGKDPNKEDKFNIIQSCQSYPRFFRDIPVNPEGFELFGSLKGNYDIKILTTPMEYMEWCKYDKVQWVKENLGNYDVYFSDQKYRYVGDNQSILIDDNDKNIQQWNDAGGTGIKFPQKTDRILAKIHDVFHPEDEALKIKNQIKNMIVNTQPSEKQKISGLYKKGKLNIKGLDIRIENPKGSIRWGFDESGKKWVSKMKHHYGYIVGSDGNDYDPIDIFIGPEPNRSLVFVINQMKNGIFDEHKCMIGFDSEDEAKKAYLSNYQKGWEKNIHSIVRSNTKKLRNWIESGDKHDLYK